MKKERTHWFGTYAEEHWDDFYRHLSCCGNGRRCGWDGVNIWCNYDPTDPSKVDLGSNRAIIFYRNGGGSLPSFSCPHQNWNIQNFRGRMVELWRELGLVNEEESYRHETQERDRLNGWLTELNPTYLDELKAAGQVVETTLHYDGGVASIVYEGGLMRQLGGTRITNGDGSETVLKVACKHGGKTQLLTFGDLATAQFVVLAEGEHDAHLMYELLRAQGLSQMRFAVVHGSTALWSNKRAREAMLERMEDCRVLAVMDADEAGEAITELLADAGIQSYHGKGGKDFAEWYAAAKRAGSLDEFAEEFIVRVINAPYYSTRATRQPAFVRRDNSFFERKTDEDGRVFYARMTQMGMARVFGGKEPLMSEDEVPCVARETEKGELSSPAGIIMNSGYKTLVRYAATVPYGKPSPKGCPHIDAALHALLNDPAKERIFKLWCGTALMRAHGAPVVKNHALMVLGNSDSGKSGCIIKVARELVGRQATDIPQNYLSGKSAFSGQMKDVAIWCADDKSFRSDNKMEIHKRIKELIAPNEIQMENKGKDAVEIRLRQSVIIAANPEDENRTAIPDFISNADVNDKGIVLWLDAEAKARFRELCKAGEWQDRHIAAEIEHFRWVCETLALEEQFSKGGERWLQEAYYDDAYRSYIRNGERSAQLYDWITKVIGWEHKRFASGELLNEMRRTNRLFDNITTPTTLTKVLKNLAEDAAGFGGDFELLPTKTHNKTMFRIGAALNGEDAVQMSPEMAAWLEEVADEIGA